MNPDVQHKEWQSIDKTNQESNQYLQFCRSKTNFVVQYTFLTEAVVLTLLLYKTPSGYCTSIASQVRVIHFSWKLRALYTNIPVHNVHTLPFSLCSHCSHMFTMFSSLIAFFSMFTLFTPVHNVHSINNNLFLYVHIVHTCSQCSQHQHVYQVHALHNTFKYSWWHAMKWHNKGFFISLVLYL